MIDHLGEVDARRLHAGKGFASLFGYCVERLGFSEDEACRRIEAARLARRFPAIHPLLETGAVSLTVLGLLKHHLTPENCDELLASVSGASVRQAKEKLAARFPQPDVPWTIRKQNQPVELNGAAPGVSAPGASGGVAPTRELSGTLATMAPAPARALIEPLSPERFLVKFTASRVLRDKIEMDRRNETGIRAGVTNRDLVRRVVRGSSFCGAGQMPCWAAHLESRT